MKRCLLLPLLLAGFPVEPATAAPLERFTLVDGSSPALAGALDRADRFGRDLAGIGDIDGDGIPDLIAGTRSDDDGAKDAGAAYVLFLNRDGTVRKRQKLSALEGGFGTGFLQGMDSTFLGYGVAGLGDVNRDGVPDVALTQTRSGAARGTGALHVVFLNRDGTVRSKKTTQGVPGFGLASLGDLDKDGRVELAACAPEANDGGAERGAIVIYSVNRDGSLQERRRIASNSGGFGSGLKHGDRFGGRDVAVLGDLDGNGTPDLAVGAFGSDEGRGAVWILRLDRTLSVIGKSRIGTGTPGFALPLDPNDNFGHAVAGVGDLDGDGVGDLITGANRDDDAGVDDGCLVAVLLNRDGSLKAARKFTGADEEFRLELPEGGRFGRSLGVVGDLAGDGTFCLAVGGGAGITGSITNLFLNPAALATMISSEPMPVTKARPQSASPAADRTSRRPRDGSGASMSGRRHDRGIFPKGNRTEAGMHRSRSGGE